MSIANNEQIGASVKGTARWRRHCCVTGYRGLQQPLLDFGRCVLSHLATPPEIVGGLRFSEELIERGFCNVEFAVPPLITLTNDCERNISGVGACYFLEGLRSRLHSREAGLCWGAWLRRSGRVLGHRDGGEALASAAREDITDHNVFCTSMPTSCGDSRRAKCRPRGPQATPYQSSSDRASLPVLQLARFAAFATHRREGHRSVLHNSVAGGSAKPFAVREADRHYPHEARPAEEISHEHRRVFAGWKTWFGECELWRQTADRWRKTAHPGACAGGKPAIASEEAGERPVVSQSIRCPAEPRQQDKTLDIGTTDNFNIRSRMPDPPPDSWPRTISRGPCPESGCLGRRTN